MTQKDEEQINIRAGEVVVFTSGEYSDFGINAILVAVEDINYATIKEIEEQARLEEEYRVSLLSLHERIEESNASDDVKAILRIIAEKAGVDIWDDS